MKIVRKTTYRGVCDACGCRKRAEYSVSALGVADDVRLCGDCLAKIGKGIAEFFAEEKKNERKK